MPSKPPKPSPAKESPGINLDALTGDLAALRLIAGDSVMSEACELLRHRLKLTPAKVMVMLMRRLAPDARVQQGEEATCRGMDTEILKDAKDRGEFAREMSGLQIPVKEGTR